ncbi:MAG: ABC transporter ATP-binding protein [Planctomycetes bacterium]|nr:ABC transporter ATP-binding protein [Planctomycetota bacterium]MCG2684398.1 ABC transporter ATP-binding protein [Planctomycetales bacterium]
MSQPTADEANRVLLRLRNVGKTFQMGEVAVEALSDVSLDIYAGEFLVMVGPSGSGKTTILNLVGGLDSVTAGRVWFEDREITAFTAAELTRYRRETVGFVFQFYNLVPNLTACENVMVSTELSRDPMDVVESLRLVDMEDRMDHFPSQLSGGEQQRVAIARALAKNPTLLLCDEPTGALDFATGKRVLRTLLDLKRQLGKTVVLITHNSAIAQMADRVVRLRSGQIVELHDNPQPLPPEEVVW